MRFLAAVMLLTLAAGTASAVTVDGVRFEFSNLLEFQNGRDFSAEEDDRRRFFNQFILDVYPSDEVRLGLRWEQFQDSTPPELFGFPTPEYEYNYLAQRFVEWSSTHVTARVGNGYSIFGHGLILRAFELPGVVRQSLFPIVSYAESRDLDGVIVDSWYGPVEFSVVHGKPVIDPEAPPEQENRERRGGSVTGMSGMVRPVNWLGLGGSWLSADGVEPGATGSMPEEFGAVQLEFDLIELLRPAVDLPVTLRTAVEYAGRGGWVPGEDGLTTATGAPHALYSSTQFAWRGGALGVETKDYHQFRWLIGDPPTLVPELSHRLLNRTTHVLDPLDEKGGQITLGQSLPGWLGGGSLAVIRAWSTGRREVLGEFVSPRDYEQTYVSIETDPRRAWRVEPYFSNGLDQFEGLEEILTVGGLVSFAITDEWATEADLGYQYRERDSFGESVPSDDWALVASVSRANFGSVGVLWERTNDSLFLDDPFTPELEDDPRDFLGGTLSWRANDQHDLVMFAGKRRGGTACTSGTCYYVPDFEGLEFRLLSRF